MLSPISLIRELAPRRVDPKRPLSVLLRLVPAALHAEVIAAFFNHALKGQYLREQLPELDGKRIAVAISDTGTVLQFVVRGQRLASSRDVAADVCIEGGLEELWLLATRREDPDTLFFNRRLAISGDVATGLLLKNLLDSLDYDWDAHLKAVFGGRAGGILARLPPPRVRLLP